MVKKGLATMIGVLTFTFANAAEDECKMGKLIYITYEKCHYLTQPKVSCDELNNTMLRRMLRSLDTEDEKLLFTLIWAKGLKKVRETACEDAKMDIDRRLLLKAKLKKVCNEE